MKRAARMARYLGGGWVAFRLSYAARTKLGVLRRRTPVRAWDEIPLQSFLRGGVPSDPAAYRRYREDSGVRFLFDRLSSNFPPPAAADAIVRGRFPYFDGSTFDMGIPPDWLRNPATDERIPADRHWSEVEEFASGDIKMVWEASRFLFVYPLVRAYASTRNEVYAETFWKLVEDWRANNPPNAGPNWRCGQETTFRVFAWCFGLYGFASSPATTDARVAMLAQMIAASGARIEANIDYAVSQKNNHGISEAAGLFTIGLLFPELESAGRWVSRGRRLLERQARELIYDDGAFSQHSMNYERVALHVLVWAMRLAERNGVTLDVRDRVSRAARFLHQLQDETTGRLPHYGHNDGALILPLSNCEARDYRPVIAAATWTADRVRVYPGGPWDEEVFWLCGEDALAAPVVPRPRTDLRATDGGYFTLRSDHGFLFVRAPKFRHRPAQADLLHVDVWWRGVNVAMDGGTFSYNAAGPLPEWLAGTRSHNTVSMDDQDQMLRASRFLWLPWPDAGVVRDEGSLLEVFHDGYLRIDRSARHRRTLVRRDAEAWLVADRIDAQSPHTFTLHWLLPDLPYTWDAPSLTLHMAAGDYRVRVEGAAIATLERASFAPSYSESAPALSLSMTVRGVQARFETHFSPLR